MEQRHGCIWWQSVCDVKEGWIIVPFLIVQKEVIYEPKCLPTPGTHDRRRFFFFRGCEGSA